MSLVYLDGQFLAANKARISPFDRGFLFGDGVYEVIPTYYGKSVGFKAHIDRLNKGLAELGIDHIFSYEYWWEICEGLLQSNKGPTIGVYLQVSRGADTSRSHAFPVGIEPTVFAFAYVIPDVKKPDREAGSGFKLHLSEDRRWKRCNIKSTSLLGNVLHFQSGFKNGYDETILYNTNKQLTEGSMSNVFIVQGDTVSTPIVDKQILRGVTRGIALRILREKTDFCVEERVLSVDELMSADEVWITNSIDGIAPGIELDGVAIGGGLPGKVWERVAQMYDEFKFDL